MHCLACLGGAAFTQNVAEPTMPGLPPPPPQIVSQYSSLLSPMAVDCLLKVR